MLEKVGAHARLLRLSNAPTAVADVWMGYAVASHSLGQSGTLALATLASLCAYHGGMALNDAMDAAADAADSRGRPIEQELVSIGFALFLGYLLLTSCFGISCVLFLQTGQVAALFLSASLVAAVVSYNSRYKTTLAGPLLMGLCRFLNVGIGSAVGEPIRDVPPPLKGSSPPGIQEAWLAGVMIGTYIVGVTYFARNEATDTNRYRLLGATAISAASFAFFGYGQRPPVTIEQSTWWLLWGILALFATRGMVAAIIQPTPRNIGRGVGIAIQGIIVIDATLAALYAGPMAGLAIFALLPVTMLLSRWIPQT